MTVVQSNRFKKAYKKLHSNQLADANKAIETVIGNPDIGERKKGRYIHKHPEYQENQSPYFLNQQIFFLFVNFD